MYSLDVDKYSIEIGDLLDSSFEKLLSQYSSSKKVIIVDGNTNKYCLHHLIKKFKSLNKAKIIVLPAGEKNKQITSSIPIWKSLTEYGIGRHDLIINLGGGVVTDMGGFIACSSTSAVKLLKHKAINPLLLRPPSGESKCNLQPKLWPSFKGLGNLPTRSSSFKRQFLMLFQALFAWY